jgi:hypothetical protein
MTNKTAVNAVSSPRSTTVDVRSIDVEDVQTTALKPRVRFRKNWICHS